MARLKPNGTPHWLNHYSGSGFFASDYCGNADLSTDQAILLSSGFFLESNSLQPFAYTLAVNPDGSPQQINHYANGGAYPHVSSTFEAMAYNPVNGKVALAGIFISSINSGTWPQGPNPQSFYLVGAHSEGITECVEFDEPIMTNTDYDLHHLDKTPFNLGTMSSSPVVAENVDPHFANQCSANKWREIEAAKSADLQIASRREDFAFQWMGQVEPGDKLEILDLQGRVLKQFPLSNREILLEKGSLPAGLYFVRGQQQGSLGFVNKIWLH